MIGHITRACISALIWHYTMEPMRGFRQDDPAVRAVFAWITWQRMEGEA